MSILDRVADVIKSYLNDDDKASHNTRHYDNDPDYEAAFQELNDYLNREESRTASSRQKYTEYTGTGTSRGDYTPDRVPEDLRKDFAELGLPAGSSPEACKAAHKKLLKIHHPDRHAEHPGNMKKATEKTARINAAYDRIEKWHQTEKTLK
jgi:DnaJ-domain-containing protein 1